jgi:GNAT superfamily N-acetyltransferase
VSPGSDGPGLRAAKAADAAAIADLIWRCDNTFLSWAPDGWEPPAPGRAKAKWERRLRDDRNWTRLGFDRDGILIAMLSWCPGDDAQLAAQDGSSAYLRSVFVDPSRWREGIGSRLMAIAEDAMLAHGFRASYLWTPREGEARAFYEALGWRATAHRHWEPDLEAMMVSYEKRLY